MPLEPFEPPLRHPPVFAPRAHLGPRRRAPATRLQNPSTPAPSGDITVEPDRMRRADRLFQIVQLIRGRRLS
ncbi:MAG: hypothetical protein ABW190_09700, partial [Rhizobacter sp.]